MSKILEFRKQIKSFLLTHLQIEVKDVHFFEWSLTHKSFLHKNPDKDLYDYDSLEFLGDSVINWIVSSSLFDINRTSETMTKLRQQIIQSKSLVITAKKIKLETLIRTGKSLNHLVTDSIVGDIFESFCAAIYLTCGFSKAEEFIKKTLWNDFLHKEFDNIIDYKTLLQEFVHKKYKTPVQYSYIKHNETYKVSCVITSEIQTIFCGTKLKDAEQQCAKQLLLDCLTK